MTKILAIAVLFASTAFAQPKNVVAVTIESGQSLSSVARLRSENLTQLCTPTAILMPSAWTTAGLTFQVSVDGTTFFNLYDDSGAEVSVSTAANRAVYIPAAYFWGMRFLKVRSGTAAAPVNQGAARTLQVVCRD